MEVSGLRRNSENLQRQYIKNIEDLVTEAEPESSQRFKKYMAEIQKFAPTFDDMIKIALPVYQKYFSVEEIQELNKFYSTAVMQDYVKKIPLVTQELAQRDYLWTT
jgi:hypothetical protein